MANALRKMLLVALVLCALPGCQQSGFSVPNLAKGDVDFVSDAHYREVQSLLRELTVKLYRRNPSQLAKKPGTSLDMRLDQLFRGAGPVIVSELDFVQGTQALALALDEDFKGDRVLALMAGLNGMTRNAYGNRSQSFMFDQLDEQKLYDSARNIEILIWRLRQASSAGSLPLILTNNLPGEPVNLSFERLFGKLIALQDMMAMVVSQQNNRLINKVTQNIASLVFFPL